VRSLKVDEIASNRDLLTQTNWPPRNLGRFKYQRGIEDYVPNTQFERDEHRNAVVDGAVSTHYRSLTEQAGG
jgi:hypothetical protein